MENKRIRKESKVVRKMNVRIFEEPLDFLIRLDKRQNGVSQEFLDKKGLKLEDLNLVNCKGCWNSYNCKDCEYTSNSYDCINLDGCESCKHSKNCYSSTGCINCGGCRYRGFKVPKQEPKRTKKIDIKIFKNIEEFIERKNRKQNGVSQKFLDKKGIKLKDLNLVNCIACWNCYNCTDSNYCYNSEDCEDCNFLENCESCKGCTGLHFKQNFLNNKLKSLKFKENEK